MSKGGHGIKDGESDEFSIHAAVNRTMCHDQHATILRLLGLDHERLSFRHNGGYRRLSDVHGHVIREVITEGHEPL